MIDALKRENATLLQTVRIQAVTIENQQQAIDSLKEEVAASERNLEQLTDDLARSRVELAALKAQPVQKPVCQLHPDHFKPNSDGTEWCREALLYSPNNEGDKLRGVNTRVKLYAAPVQPMQPAPLTVENIRAVNGIVHSDGNIFFTNLAQLNRAIEAAIKGQTK